MEWINCFKEPPPECEKILAWYKTWSGYWVGEAWYETEENFPWHIPGDEWDDDTPWAKKDKFGGGMRLSHYAVKYWMPLPDGPDDEDVNP